MEVKIDIYNSLVDNYFSIIDELINFSNEKNIIPRKVIFFIPIMKKYIETNRLSVIQNSIKFFLEYKDEITNFNIENLNSNDEKNIDEIKKMMYENIHQNKIDIKEIEIFDLILELKDNSLKLKNEDKILVKQYIELLIIILEKIRNLF